VREATSAGAIVRVDGERTAALDAKTGLALSRTLLALDRTLMAWVRTATSLISFGFTIYKFFQYLRQGQPAGHIDHLMGPRAVALVMIGMGVGALVLATIEHAGQRRALTGKYPGYGPFPRPLAVKIAAVFSCIGFLGFVLVFLRQ
jgi:putative membrane protein